MAAPAYPWFPRMLEMNEDDEICRYLMSSTMVIAKACKKYLSMFPLIRLPYMPYFIAGICDKEYQCEKYINIPSEKYIYVHIYVYICVYTYLCKMDEYRSYAGLSKKWMSTGIMLACHKNGCAPVLCWLFIKMDEYRYYAGLS